MKRVLLVNSFTSRFIRQDLSAVDPLTGGTSFWYDRLAAACVWSADQRDRRLGIRQGV